MCEKNNGNKFSKSSGNIIINQEITQCERCVKIQKELMKRMDEIVNILKKFNGQILLFYFIHFVGHAIF